MRSTPVSRLLLALFTSVLISCGGGGSGGESNSGGGGGSPTTPSVVDVTAPRAPASLRAEGKSATSVSLSWSAASDDQGVTGYQIYRNGSLVSLVQGSLLNYIDTGLVPGSSYRYSIKAVDAAGNLSPASAEFLVSTNSQSTPDAQAPSAPPASPSAAAARPVSASPGVPPATTLASSPTSSCGTATSSPASAAPCSASPTPA